MREIILIGTKENSEVKSLVVSEIAYEDIAPDALEGVDSLIFTSKNAILALIESAKKHEPLRAWVNIPSYVIGHASAKALQNACANIAHIGSDAHGANFAKELIELLADKNPLYLRAQNIVSKLDEKLISANIKLKQIVAYINQPKKLDSALKPKGNSVLIFTSPSTFAFFKQNFGWNPNYVAVAIGMTTFSAFDSDMVAFVSQKQNIEGCIELAKDLAQKLP